MCVCVCVSVALLSVQSSSSEKLRVSERNKKRNEGFLNLTTMKLSDEQTEPACMKTAHTVDWPACLTACLTDTHYSGISVCDL